MMQTRKCFILGAAWVLLMPAAAQAQTPAENDPSADSPAGSVYEIPLDRARRDAAPRGGGRRGFDQARDSPIRSENGFGSSSTVPAAAPAGGMVDADGDGSGTTGAPTAGGPDGATGDGTEGASSGGGATGGSGGSGGSGGDGGSSAGGTGGSSSGGPGAPQSTAEQLISPNAAATPEPSSTRAYLLVGLGVLLAVGLGVAARRAVRQR
jgi:hypothetical protein